MKVPAGVGRAFERLVEIMAKLRSPEGCPWDRAQDFSSLRRYVIEEAYEVVSAIDRGDREELKEELGDLLLQVVFLSRISQEEGSFNVKDVIESLCDKLIRRHPHVFGEEIAETPEEVLSRWKEIKSSEGKRKNDEKAFPALLQAVKAGKRAAEKGYDWDKAEDVLEKIEEELEELKGSVGDPVKLERELGDLLFAVANFARKAGVDPEVALAGAVRRFERRFQEALKIIATRYWRDASQLSPEELDEVWQEVKKRLGE